MLRTGQPLLRRLAGAAAATGLAVAGLVVAAAPASAAACSGTTGVTVVVDTGSSISTRCASGDPSTALNALTSAGFSVTYPQQYPGSVVCRINGYPSSDRCVVMPPASAYWAFFHATRGGSWVYSSNGVASYDPAPGTVVGFRFGSGQQPRIAPPAPATTSTPKPTTTTAKPRSTTSAPRPTTPRTTETSATVPPGTASTPATVGGSASARPTGTPKASGTASASPSPASSTDATPTTSPTDLAAAPTSAAAGGGGPGTLLVGAALVALVAAGAGWAAWKRRS